MRQVVKIAPKGMRLALEVHLGRFMDSPLWAVSFDDGRRPITFYAFADHGGIWRSYFRKDEKFEFACTGKTRDEALARACALIRVNTSRAVQAERAEIVARHLFGAGWRAKLADTRAALALAFP